MRYDKGDVTRDLLPEARRYARELAADDANSAADVVVRVAAWLADVAVSERLSALDMVDALDPTATVADYPDWNRPFTCPRCQTTLEGGDDLIGHCPFCGARLVRRGVEDLLDEGAMTPKGSPASLGLAVETGPVGSRVWRWHRAGSSWVADVAWLAGVDDVTDALVQGEHLTSADVCGVIGEYATAGEAAAAARHAFEGRAHD